MGNDGGSIPTRRELVKSASREPTVSELKATALESLNHAWTHCPLSGDKLDMENAVSDWRGMLYNYESVLKGLMPSDDGESESPPAAHLSFSSTGIKSLRDIVRVKFGQTSPPGGKSAWACPVSMKPFGATTKAVYIVPCAHAFSDVAIKEIQEHVCPECSEPFEEQNVIPILPTTEAETRRLIERIERLQEEGQSHSLKKDKKAGKKKRKRTDDENTRAVNGGDKENGDKSRTVKKDDRLNGINNPMASSLAAKVLAEQDEMNKRRKIAALAGR